jgi:hypothetical protein
VPESKTPRTGDDGSTYTLRRVQAMLGLSRTIVAGLIAAAATSGASPSRI